MVEFNQGMQELSNRLAGLLRSFEEDPDHLEPGHSLIKEFVQGMESIEKELYCMVDFPDFSLTFLMETGESLRECFAKNFKRTGTKQAKAA